MSYQSTKLIELGSCAFRQWRAVHSHCQYVHGYQLKAKFYFGASELDELNWVVDFAGLKELKVILNNQFDHTLCVAQDDPLLPFWQELNNQRGCQLRVMESVGIEKTAEWCFKAANDFITTTTGGRCWVDSVEVFEHENNSAIFFKQDTISTQKEETKQASQSEVIAKSTAAETPLPVKSEPVQNTQPQQQSPNQPVNRPVPLRNPVTTGYSGLFDNISWGSGR